MRATGYLPITEIPLESGHRLEVIPLFHGTYNYSIDRRVLISFAVAILANLFVMAAMALSFHAHAPRLTRVRDISKIQLSLASSNTSRVLGDPSALAALQQARETRRAQKLMDSWGVGKPIQNANQVLKPGVYDRAFSAKSGGAALPSWQVSTSVDEDQLQKPLNLSDEEIARALRAVSVDLRECYNQVLIRDTTLKGKPQVILDISEAGRIQTLDLLGLNAQSSSITQLRACFLKAYEQVLLKKPNQPFVVTQTLVLSY